jgi:hypothetical protein
MKNSILDKEHISYTDTSKEIPTWIQTNVPEVPDIFKEFAYHISSWPVILDEKKAKDLKELSSKVFKMIRSIPSLYFDNDEQKIADYYFEGNSMLGQFAMISHNKVSSESCCRIDLTYTNEGFKVLEANIGSSIGGWQLQSFTEIINKTHPQLQQNYQSVNTQYIYFEFLVKNIIKYVHSIEGEINIFISMDDVQEGQQHTYLVEFLNELLSKTLSDKNLKGKVFIGSLSKLKLSNTILHLGGERIHAVLNMSSEEITIELMRAFMMDAIYFPDHLGVTMYRKKSNLELLRELAENKKFSQEDNDFILKVIPWTATIKEGKEVVFKGNRKNISTLLKGHKNQLVIKDNYGEQGKDVFIGKFLSTSAWEEVIKLALKEEKFIAQEFSESINFSAPNSNNDWTDHKIVWGSFGFGEVYGGVFVRMSEVKTDTGIINAARGAVEAIVYESI